MQTGVLTCGTINGGYTHNIIADNVKITGTTRSFTPETQVMDWLDCVNEIVLINGLNTRCYAGCS